MLVEHGLVVGEELHVADEGDGIVRAGADGIARHVARGFHEVFVDASAELVEIRQPSLGHEPGSPRIIEHDHVVGGRPFAHGDGDLVQQTTAGELQTLDFDIGILRLVGIDGEFQRLGVAAVTARDDELLGPGGIGAKRQHGCQGDAGGNAEQFLHLKLPPVVRNAHDCKRLQFVLYSR